VSLSHHLRICADPSGIHDDEVEARVNIGMGGIGDGSCC
jgi:hypothetical protein